jgi:hypothetical protein
VFCFLLQKNPATPGGKLEIIALGEMLEIQIRIDPDPNPITNNKSPIQIVLFQLDNHYEFGTQGKSSFNIH